MVVTFGSSLAEIGENAFRGTALTEAVVPESVAKLGAGVFEACRRLARASLPTRLVEIPARTFKGCGALPHFDYPPSVRVIEAEAFKGCVVLDDPVFPETLSEIGWTTFESCGKFTSLRLPDSVTKIGGAAFNCCSELKQIELGDGVSSWCGQAFLNGKQRATTLILRGEPKGGNWSAQLIPALDPACKILRSSGQEIEKVGVVDGDRLILKDLGDVWWYSLWGHREQVKSVFVALGTCLRGAALYMARKIVSISLTGRDPREPDEQPVALMRRLESEGDAGFADGCEALETVELDNIESLGDHCFRLCRILRSIKIPSAVKVIPPNAFTNSGLEEVQLHEGIVDIGGWAFCGTSLTRVSLPDSVTTLGAYAFYWTRKLVSVSLGSGITKWGDKAFLGGNPGEPPRISTLELRGKDDCPNWPLQLRSELTDDCVITIGGSPALGAGSFTDGCLTLSEPQRTVRWFSVHTASKAAKSLVIRPGVTVTPGIFANWPELVEVDMSRSDLAELPNDGEVGLFANCKKLEVARLPPTLRIVSRRCFSGCSALRTIGVLPEGVGEVGEGAFSDSGLISIAFPNSLRTIGEWAFANAKLTEVTITDGLTQIGKGAFDGCPLAKVALGAGPADRSWGDFCFGKRPPPGAPRTVEIDWLGPPDDTRLIPSQLLDVAIAGTQADGQRLDEGLVKPISETGDTFEVGHRDDDQRSLFMKYPTIGPGGPLATAVPMLIACFDRESLMQVILPMAQAGIRDFGTAQGDAQTMAVAVDLATQLTVPSDLLVYDQAVKLYTMQTFLYQKANVIMRDAQRAVDEMKTPAPSGLWPYISILQAGLMRMPAKERGCKLYRGGLISNRELEMLKVQVRKTLVLTGFTSFTKDEFIALRFLSLAEPTPEPAKGEAAPAFRLLRAWFEIEVPAKQQIVGGLQVGAAISIERQSVFKEAEVLLIDGTTLSVDSFKPGKRSGIDCIVIRAKVDWDATVRYFSIFDKSGA